MSTDALTAIENFGSNVFTAGLTLLVSWSTLIGVVGFALVLVRAHHQAARGGAAQTGKVVTGLLFSALLTCLEPLINAAGVQFGFSTTTFGSISYVSSSTFGDAAAAANTVLTLARLAGAGMVMNGLNRLRKSGLEGHTALSASESVSVGMVKLVCGTLLVFNDTVLDALLNSLGITL